MAKRKREVSKKKEEFTIHEHLDDYILPSASDLKEYQEVDDQLIPFLQEVANKEQKFRHKMNEDAMKMSKREQSLTHGINYFALIISFLLVAGAMYISWDLLKNGKSIQGTVFGGIALAYVIYLLISVANKSAKPPSKQ